MDNRKKEYEQYIENKRRNVVEIELNARYQKANFETMHYALESEKIKADYFALLELHKQEMVKSQESGGDEAPQEEDVAGDIQDIVIPAE